MRRAANLENWSAYTEIPAVIVNNLGHILIILRLYLFYGTNKDGAFT